ncbi:MAG TPA: hypothetical protein VK894_13300 [Jiangellales bacterium]|nr:hypothetical protein [Jiangellales bacterium]
MTAPEVTGTGAAAPGLLAALRDRRPFDGHGGLSGTTLERARTTDGTPVVVKHERPEADPLLRALGDDGRLPRLWASGVLAALPADVGTAIVGVEDEPGGWAVVQLDVSEHLLSFERGLTRAENRRVLEALAGVHRSLARVRLAGTCPLPRLVAVMSPSTISDLRDDMPRLAEQVLAGWSRFFAGAPADVADLVAWVHHEPHVIAARLHSRPCTLLHGDVHFRNLALTPEQVLLLDWGGTLAVGPPAFDVATYCATNAVSIRCTPDEFLDDVRAAYGPEHDETALRLSMVAALAWLGFAKRPGSDDLAWWCDRAREGAALL